MDIHADLDGIVVTRATVEHLPAIERLLADDPTSPRHVATTTLVGDDSLGEEAADADLAAMFARIDADPNQTLVVALDDGDRVLASCQLTLVPTLARGGTYRAIVTSARIRAGADAVAIGKRLFAWTLGYARDEGARVLVVIADRDRAHMHGFFTTMGFRPSHDGLTIKL